MNCPNLTGWLSTLRSMLSQVLQQLWARTLLDYGQSSRRQFIDTREAASPSREPTPLVFWQKLSLVWQVLLPRILAPCCDYLPVALRTRIRRLRATRSMLLDSFARSQMRTKISLKLILQSWRSLSPACITQSPTCLTMRPDASAA